MTRTSTIRAAGVMLLAAALAAWARGGRAAAQPPAQEAAALAVAEPAALDPAALASPELGPPDTAGIAVAEPAAPDTAPPARGPQGTAAAPPEGSPFQEEEAKPADKGPPEKPAAQGTHKGAARKDKKTKPPEESPFQEEEAKPAEKGPPEKPAAPGADAKTAHKDTETKPCQPVFAVPATAGPADFIARAGYWGSHTSGSPAKVGEYQDLHPSPFFDVDGTFRGRERTLDYTLTGTDSESNAVRLDYYQPRFRANLDYERFPHRLRNDPLNQFIDVNAPVKPPPDDYQSVKEDLVVGKDYAVRVQELKASFRGRLTDNFKLRLDVWGLDKKGERQAIGSTFCFADPDHYPGKKCHDLSQSQRIDWRTTEVKPIIEWGRGPVVLEYSRPMRSFTQNDQIVTRSYQGTAFGSSDAPVDLPYAVVPETFTQIDQLKASAELNGENKVYALVFNGNTHKESDALPPDNPPERVGNRRFAGADVRWTNTSLPNVTVTTYGRTVSETNGPVAFAIHGEEDTPDTHFNILDQQPINYQRTQLGSKFLWRPFGRGFGLGGLALDGGYEYSILHRAFAVFPLETDATVRVNEENTLGNMAFVGSSVRWSARLDTYARYKWFAYHNPLYGVQEAFGTTNSSLPEHENLVEIGGTWVPNDRFLLNAWFNADIRRNRGAGSFDEQSYPLGINGWYAVSRRLTLTGGYAWYNNWINQDVVFGTRNDPSTDIVFDNLLPTTWRYSGRSSVVSAGSIFRCTNRLRFVGSLQYVTGINAAVLAAGQAFLSDVPPLSTQNVQTTRLTVGADCQWRPRISTYFRWVLFDYQDKAPGVNSGTSSLFLGGLSAVF